VGSDLALGISLVTLGFVTCLPVTGRLFAWLRNWQLRLMPWMRKLPGTGFLFSDAYMTWLRITVGSIFIVTGLLAIFGFVELN
jgi:hypothetical protein